MKKMILTMALALFSLAGYSQTIIGKWLTEAGDAKVEISPLFLAAHNVDNIVLPEGW